jgi:hypothetical protein
LAENGKFDHFYVGRHQKQQKKIRYPLKAKLKVLPASSIPHFSSNQGNNYQQRITRRQ